MIHLKETIEVREEIEAVYRYLLDFSLAKEWDPQVVAGRRTSSGELGLGSAFELEYQAGPKRMTLTYEVTNTDPPKTIELTGRGDGFEAIDRIFLKQTAEGTLVTYTADLEFRGASGPLKLFVEPIMRRVGKSALRQLKACLDHASEGTQRSLVDRAADGLVLPAMAGFTSWGYRLRRASMPPIDRRLDGKNVLLTGATSGIGKAAAPQLASLGARLILVGRDADKLDGVAQTCRAYGAQVDTIVADLSELREVDRAIARVGDLTGAIDVIIHNAGALATSKQVTSDGLESSFALNLIAPYRMTIGLIDRLTVAEEARVIFVSSGGAYPVQLNLNQLTGENVQDRDFDGVAAYAQAKRAQLVLTQVWSQTFADSSIQFHAMHPGWVDTPGVRESLPRFYRVTKTWLRTVDQGADTIVWLASATAPQKHPGKLWLDRKERPFYPVPGTQEGPETRGDLMALLNRYRPNLHPVTAERPPVTPPSGADV